jgi:hypothetical protein
MEMMATTPEGFEKIVMRSKKKKKNSALVPAVLEQSPSRHRLTDV